MVSKLEEQINEAIVDYCFRDKAGNPYLQYYWDYHDYWDSVDETPQKIMEADDPRTEFYDWINRVTEGCDLEYRMAEDIIKDLKDQCDIDEDTEDPQEKEYLEELQGLESYDVVERFWDMGGYVDYDEDYWLGQDVYVNLVVDAGDANYDFTLNQPIRSWDGQYEDTFDENSSLLWLVRQQGYKKSEIVSALKSEGYPEDKFLKSVVEEIENTSSHINALVFCVKMTLKRWFELHDAFEQEKAGRVKYHPRQSKGRGYIVLDKNTTCGLFDSWNGGGSLFEIKLVKDVNLPLRYIYSYDGDYHTYSIHDVYGVCREPWWDDTVKEIHPMKKKLKEKEGGNGNGAQAVC